MPIFNLPINQPNGIPSLDSENNVLTQLAVNDRKYYHKFTSPTTDLYAGLYAERFYSSVALPAVGCGIKIDTPTTDESAAVFVYRFDGGELMAVLKADWYFFKRSNIWGENAVYFADQETSEPFARFQRIGTDDWRFAVLQGGAWVTK